MLPGNRHRSDVLNRATSTEPRHTEPQVRVCDRSKENASATESLETERLVVRPIEILCLDGASDR
jgi:hypothetical protein